MVLLVLCRAEFLSLSKLNSFKCGTENRLNDCQFVVAFLTHTTDAIESHQAVAQGYFMISLFCLGWPTVGLHTGPSHSPGLRTGPLGALTAVTETVQ